MFVWAFTVGKASKVWSLLEHTNSRAKVEKYFVRFLVQVEIVEFAFEIKWPLTALSGTFFFWFIYITCLTMTLKRLFNGLFFCNSVQTLHKNLIWAEMNYVTKKKASGSIIDLLADIILTNDQWLFWSNVSFWVVQKLHSQVFGHFDPLIISSTLAFLTLNIDINQHFVPPPQKKGPFLST